jgi:hypothetical protein
MMAVQHNRPLADMRGSTSATPSSFRPAQSFLAGEVVQRAPSCACGGGCPRCQAAPGTPGPKDVSQPGDTHEAAPGAAGVRSSEIAPPASGRANPMFQPVARPFTSSDTPAAGGIGFASRPLNARKETRSVPSSSLQAKLTIGATDDPLEREADRIADQVLAKPANRQVNRGRLRIQRLSGHPTGQSDAAPASVYQALTGPGSSLEPTLRQDMEQRFGYDFSQVQVHSDTAAEQSARDLSANAYTVGHDIAFGAGQFAPGTHEGRRLIAHELTHVVQQSPVGGNSFGRSNQTCDFTATSSATAMHESTLVFARRSAHVQRSCANGDCATCAGGRKDFWITVFFRRRATQGTMTKLRAQINGAKAILANCCLDLKFDFNWSLLPGGGSLLAFEGDPAGAWHFTAQEQNLGEGTTFAGARGIPMLLVDDVPLSGGGVTVDPRFDTTYTGRSYFAIGINQTTTPNPNCNHIAHELWHVGSGLSAHDPANGTVTACTGQGVSLAYCNGLRTLV